MQWNSLKLETGSNLFKNKNINTDENSTNTTNISE